MFTSELALPIMYQQMYFPDNTQLLHSTAGNTQQANI